MDSVTDGYALWWTDGSPRVEPCAMATVGLPDVAGFTGMIDARNELNGPVALGATGGGG
jgi:hypothetical protein